MADDTRPRRRHRDQLLMPRQSTNGNVQFPPGYASSIPPPTLLDDSDQPRRTRTESQRRRSDRGAEKSMAEQDKVVRARCNLAKDNRDYTEAEYRSRISRDPKQPESLRVPTGNSHSRERSGSRSPSARSQRSPVDAEDDFSHPPSPRYRRHRRSDERDRERETTLGNDDSRGYRRSSNEQSNRRPPSRPPMFARHASYEHPRVEEPHPRARSPSRSPRRREASQDRYSREEQPRSRSRRPRRLSEHDHDPEVGPSRREYGYEPRRERSAAPPSSRSRPPARRSSHHRSGHESSIDPNPYRPRSSSKSSRPHRYRQERSDDRSPSRSRATSKRRPRKHHSSSTRMTDQEYARYE